MKFLKCIFPIFFIGAALCSCGMERGDSIVGKWACSESPSSGWQIEYRDDLVYAVTFNNGDPAWMGKYHRDGLKITYIPSDSAKSNTYFLRPEIVFIDRNKAKQVLLGGPGGDVPNSCSLVQ